MKDSKKKSPNNAPSGWALRNRYVCPSTGEVYSKGKFTGEIVGKESVKEEISEKKISEKALSELDNNTLIEQLKHLTEKVNKLENDGVFGDKQPQSLSAYEIGKGIVRGQQMAKDDVYEGYAVDVPPDDVLDIPVRFTSYGTFFLLLDKRLSNGSIEKVPYQPIKFTYKTSNSKLVGRETIKYHMCEYRSSSKTEAEWLRTHPLFNVVFYENDNKPLSSDAYLFQVAAEEAQRIRQMDQNGVLAKAQAYGVPLGRPLQTIRDEIIVKVAADRIRAEKRNISDKLKQQHEESLFIDSLKK